MSHRPNHVCTASDFPCFTERAILNLKQWERANQTRDTHALIRRGPVKHPRAPYATTFTSPKSDRALTACHGVDCSSAVRKPPLKSRDLDSGAVSDLFGDIGSVSSTQLGVHLHFGHYKCPVLLRLPLNQIKTWATLRVDLGFVCQGAFRKAIPPSATLLFFLSSFLQSKT